MKKIILLTALAITSFTAATNAQEKGGFNLGVGPVVALPLGTFGDVSGIGFGGEAQAAYGITDNIAGFVQAGYNNFLGKSYDFGGISIKGDATGVIPMLAGARFHTNGFMIGAGIGYSKFTATGGGGGFTYSPQIGYSFNRFDFIAHYTGISNNGTASFVGLKVFINFLGNFGS